ncbi:hypothetical protein TYRP_002660 [Tyrophagus putrescentiae]|nr:hypothetical protein TYRP_002660 [Tyrophagus putrescentiae]
MLLCHHPATVGKKEAPSNVGRIGIGRPVPVVQSVASCPVENGVLLGTKGGHRVTGGENVAQGQCRLVRLMSPEAKEEGISRSGGNGSNSNSNSNSNSTIIIDISSAAAAAAAVDLNITLFQ